MADCSKLNNIRPVLFFGYGRILCLVSFATGFKSVRRLVLSQIAFYERAFFSVSVALLDAYYRQKSLVFCKCQLKYISKIAFFLEYPFFASNFLETTLKKIQFFSTVLVINRPGLGALETKFQNSKGMLFQMYMLSLF